MYIYNTVTQEYADLIQRGYTSSFAVRRDCTYCENKQIRLKPTEFRIDEVYRFEGNSDPADETIVYAVSAIDESFKGILINA